MRKTHIPGLLRPLTLAALGLVFMASMAIGQSIQWGTPSQSAPLPPDQAFVLETGPAPGGGLILHWRVTPGYYLYQDQFEVRTPDGPVPLDLPEAEMTEDLTYGLTAIYRQDVTLTLPALDGPVSLRWQGCQEDGICYPPQSAELEGGQMIPASVTAPPAAAAPAPVTLAAQTGLMDRLGAQGTPVLLLAFFGFGLALAFTPCVLPMVPILGAYLARDGARMTRRRGFTLSLAYAVAMASAFGLLGLAAAATGQNLQMLLQSPVALGLIIALFVTLAVSMFGLFDISLPGGWIARLQGTGAGARGTVPGALGLGFTSALVVGPCVTAPLAAALLYIAQTGDMALGSAALFALGLGKGAPLVVFGTLGSKYLPRSGPWMVRVKQGFGFVFLGLALWLAERLGPGPWILAGWGLLLAAFALFLLRAVLPDMRSRGGRLTAAGLAVTALLPAALLGLGALRGAEDPLRPLATETRALAAGQAWQIVTDRAGLQTALAAPDRPVALYLTADWCVSCRTIERRVLPDAAVAATLAPMQRIKVDLSDFGAEGQALMRDLGAAGPPTMIFLDAALREVDGTRLIGETRAAAVVEAAQRVQP